jgi:hypothetical protein
MPDPGYDKESYAVAAVLALAAFVVITVVMVVACLTA